MKRYAVIRMDSELLVVDEGNITIAEGAPLATLRAQRDELLAALEVISGEPRRDDTYVGMSPVQIARHALRKVS